MVANRGSQKFARFRQGEFPEFFRPKWEEVAINGRLPCKGAVIQRRRSESGPGYAYLEAILWIGGKYELSEAQWLACSSLCIADVGSCCRTNSRTQFMRLIDVAFRCDDNARRGWLGVSSSGVSIIAELNANDVEFLDRIYSLHQRAVVAALRRSFSLLAIEDALEDMKMLLLLNRDLLKSLTPIQCRAWLRKSTKHRVIDRIRKYRKESEWRDGLDDSEDDEDENEVFIECVERLNDCISQLDPRDKELIHGKYHEGHSCKELATQLGYGSENAVSKRLLLVRADLGVCIQGKKS